VTVGRHLGGAIEISLKVADFRNGSSLCGNSEVELARRNFVSITLNRKRQHWQSQSREEKGENNSAHSLLARVFT
jgi:hypothetical protein